MQSSVKKYPFLTFTSMLTTLIHPLSLSACEGMGCLHMLTGELDSTCICEARV